jgi:hypothetical protein
MNSFLLSLKFDPFDFSVFVFERGFSGLHILSWRHDYLVLLGFILFFLDDFLLSWLFYNLISFFLLCIVVRTHSHSS